MVIALAWCCAWSLPNSPSRTTATASPSPTVPTDTAPTPSSPRTTTACTTARVVVGWPVSRLAAQVVTALQALVARNLDPLDPAVLTIGRLEGGTKADLIADRAHFEGIVRTMSDANRKKIARLMDSVIKGIVHGFGGDYTFSFSEDLPSVSNHPELLDLMTPSLNEALGDRKVSPIKPQMMADDFSLYGQKIPALFFFLGARNPRLPAAALYSPAFNPDERSIGIGMKILCHLLLDCLEQQSRLEKSGI